MNHINDLLVNFRSLMKELVLCTENLKNNSIKSYEVIEEYRDFLTNFSNLEKIDAKALANIEKFDKKIDSIYDKLVPEEVIAKDTTNPKFIDAQLKLLRTFVNFLNQLSTNFHNIYAEIAEKFPYNNESIYYLLKLGLQYKDAFENAPMRNRDKTEAEAEKDPNLILVQKIIGVHEWLSLEFSVKYFKDKLEKFDKKNKYMPHWKTIAEIIKSKVDLKQYVIFKELDKETFAFDVKPSLYLVAHDEHYFLKTIKRLFVRRPFGSITYRVGNQKDIDIILFSIIIFAWVFESLEVVYAKEIGKK